MTEQAFRIPRDPEARRRLADFAGLTDEERAAIDAWCAQQESEYRKQRGIDGIVP